MSYKPPASIARPELLQILEKGELATELMVLSELTGNLDYAERWSQHIIGAAPWQIDFPSSTARQIRELLADAILDRNADTTDEGVIRPLLDHCVGHEIPSAEHEMLLKEMGISDIDEVNWSGGRPKAADDFKVLIIGAGPSGIVAATRLKKLGINFEILEKDSDFGGTWHSNTYPGCGVDIASHYFSYSFDRNPEWKRYYAKQPEILAYLQESARKADLRDHVRFNTEVTTATYDESSAQWVVELLTPTGQSEVIMANIVISAAGLLNRPSIPHFEGLKDFAGDYFHSADWDHDVAIDGKRVALFGTGASANQIGPAICDQVEHLTVVQRSAHWNVGVENYHDSVSAEEKWLLENVPAYERWFRVRSLLSQNDVNRQAQIVDPEWTASDGSISEVNAQVWQTLTEYINEQLGDRTDLRVPATPTYPPFSKRILRDNGWYKMLVKDNVELVPSAEVTFTPEGFIDKDGVPHDVDVCVFATGFEASKMLATYSIVGRNGMSIRDVWGDDDPSAYLGMAVPNFPNFFILYGPNTNIGTGGSMIFQAETWSRYVTEIIVSMIENRITSVECRPEANDEYNNRVTERLASMVWSVSPAATWYRNSSGRVTTNMPWTTFEYWAMTRRAQLDHYKLNFAETASTENPPADLKMYAGSIPTEGRIS